MEYDEMLRMVDGCGWLWMVMDGYGWLWMVMAYMAILGTLYTLLHVMQHLDLAGLSVKRTLFRVEVMIRYFCSLFCFCHVALSALPSLEDDTTCLAPEAEHLAIPCHLTTFHIFAIMCNHVQLLSIRYIHLQSFTYIYYRTKYTKW